MGSRDKVRLARIAFQAGLLYLFIRLFFGVDFTDEGFYASIPYRFFLGDRPFVDETAIHQTAGFLTFPWVWIFVSLTKSTTGILLFLRLLFFALTCIAARAVFRFFREQKGQIAGFHAALLYLLLTPEIPTLSYNSMGVAFFTLAIFSRSGWARGLACGLASVAYPPLILISPFVFALLGKRDWTWRSGLRFWIPFVLGLLPILIAVSQSGLPAILQSYRETSAIVPKGGGLDKITSLAKHFWHSVVTAAVPLALALGLARIGKARFQRWALPAFVAVLLIRFGENHIPDLVISSVLLLPFFTYSEWSTEFRLRYGLSVFAGLLFAWASSNGAVNFYFGAIPALLIALPISAVTPAFVALLVLSSATHVYRDQPLWKLTQPISSGPHAGLFTSNAKASFVRSLLEARDLTDASADAVIYMNDFPGGFLYSTKQPAVCSTWIFTPWDPSQREFRTKYRECVKPANRRLVTFAKRDVRDRNLAPISTLEDPFDLAIWACASETLIDNADLRVFSIKQNCP